MEIDFSGSMMAPLSPNYCFDSTLAYFSFINPLVDWAADLRDDAQTALDEARQAVEAEDWEVARDACREALRLLVQAGMTQELGELEALEQRARDGEAKSRERREGAELVQKAKAALGGGDFEGAREALREAKGAFRRAGWEEGEQELAAIFGLVDAGERRVRLREEGEKALKAAEVLRTLILYDGYRVAGITFLFSHV